MSLALKMPQTGMGITEGTVVKWHKAPGEPICLGELLVEIETAKAIVEVPSPITGVLERILLAQGETAEVNTTIAWLQE
jgi:2-oxoisovalerate dehydrogenase E2 component (dihydrolipoyl transacylase)